MEDLETGDIRIIDDNHYENTFDAPPSQKKNDELAGDISLDNSTNYESGKTSLASSNRVIIKNEDLKDIYYPGKSLTEPIWFSFHRDLSKILNKVKFVAKHKKSDEELAKGLKDPDIWGPFLLCLFLSV
jgi:hypothetical protein